MSQFTNEPMSQMELRLLDIFGSLAIGNWLISKRSLYESKHC
jgi:hypothetical protein